MYHVALLQSTLIKMGAGAQNEEGKNNFTLSNNNRSIFSRNKAPAP